MIAFLELLAASVFSSGPSFFFFLALFLLSAVATFSSGEIRHASQRSRIVRSGMRAFSRRLSLLILFTSLGILTLTFLIFFVLPRTARAAIQQFGATPYHVPGFSNEVRLGQIGEYQQRGTPVMHIRVLNGAPAANLKWRGSALAEFDGARWFNSNPAGEILRLDRRFGLLSDPTRPWRNGRRIAYEVELRSLGADALFFAGTPESIQVDAPTLIRTPVDGYRIGFAESDALRYTAGSLLDDYGTIGGPLTLSAAQLRLYLRLPRLDPRIPALARDWTAGATTDAARARLIETRFHRDFRYSLDLLRHPPRHPLPEFLFVRRAGHCEYFASAMAVMLRTVGVPARVATGFQSGVFNQISGRQLIRSSDAHSWVEVFVPNQGWTTFDPTPPDPSAGAISPWTRLLLYADAAQTFWEEWVLNYDLERQWTLASRMEQSGRTLRLSWVDKAGAAASQAIDRTKDWVHRYGPRLGVALVALICLLAPVFPAFRLLVRRSRVERLRRGQASASDATLLYQRMLELLRRRGFEKPAWLTPAEFAQLLPQTPSGLLVRDLTTAYNDLRFGHRPEAAPKLLALLERLEHAD